MPDLSLVNLLGWSLQAALLIAAAALAARLMPVDSPSVRHGWWRAVLVVSLALPVLQAWHPAPAGPIAAVDTTALISPIAGSPAAADAPVVTPSLLGAFVNSFERIVLIAIVCGIAARLTWLAAGLAHLRRLRRVGRVAALADIDADLQTLVPAGTAIKYVDAVGQPVTFGIRRPVVVLPEGMRTLPPAVQRAVVAHELWHVRRHDWGWLVAEEILRGVLWFHPAIWWLISRIQTTREEVVDELTVLVTSSRRGYLEALLAFADQPPLFAAAPFARRRHLYHRMLLLSREAVMSSRRIVASCAGMVLVAVVAGWYGVSAFPLVAAPAAGAAQTQPPRDPRPSDARPATARELALRKVATGPQADAGAFEELARLQEARGALAEAEATLVALTAAQPRLIAARNALAAFYNRTGQFDRTIATLEAAAALDPSNPEGHHVIATFYFDKASKDPSLTPAQQLTYIHAGLAAEDRALALRPEYVEAMIYKNILLRMEAKLDGDPARRATLVAEADALRGQAMAFKPKNPPPAPPPGTGSGPRPGMPPPPPPPPPPGDDAPSGATPVRVGSQIMTPTKIVDVKPEYPALARAAGVQGVVVLEALIDEAGNVKEAHVLRSIPLLDQAALDAVRQWKYRPTLLNGQAVPVIMTMTINFAQ